MPEDEAREGTEIDPEIATPGRALEHLRARVRDSARQMAREVGRAAVEVSGEVGYRKLTVALILDRSGANRTGFYQRFANRHDAYGLGYEEGIEALAADVLTAGRSGSSWAEGLSASLALLADFANADPLYADGLLAQVHVAGGAAFEKRSEVFGRLARAIDGARGLAAGTGHSPPPIAADFIISAIEQSIISALGRGVPEEFSAGVPDLVHLAVSTYFGSEAPG